MTTIFTAKRGMLTLAVRKAGNVYSATLAGRVFLTRIVITKTDLAAFIDAVI